VGDRANELRNLLNDWDFIGVADPETNTDEYDCMIEPLLRSLSAGAGPGDIKRLLDDEITGHFGLSPVTAGTAPMAERLTTWWQTTQR
jgi:hypothetical protein